MPLISKLLIEASTFQQFPTNDFIPGNTVIFYIGANTASLVDKFEVYSNAYNKVIKCASTFSEVGITTNGIAGSDPIGYLTESGQHQGLTKFEVHGGGSAQDNPIIKRFRSGVAAGIHSHTVSGIAGRINNKIPPHFNTEVYRCIRKEGTYLPKDCVVFGEFFSEVYFKRYEGASNTLIYGSLNNVGYEKGSNTLSFIILSTANGAHAHTSTLQDFINPNVTSYAFVERPVKDHIHQVDFTWSIINKSKYLKAWVSLADDTPVANGMIVAYAGNTSEDLPAKWYLCNGANSTPDLREYYILANGKSETHNTVAFTNNQVICTLASPRVNTVGIGHTHKSNEKVLSQGSPVIAGAHDDFSWEHTHAMVNTVVGTTINYEPPSIKLAFIMYKA